MCVVCVCVCVCVCVRACCVCVVCVSVFSVWGIYILALDRRHRSMRLWTIGHSEALWAHSKQGVLGGVESHPGEGSFKEPCLHA